MLQVFLRTYDERFNMGYSVLAFAFGFCSIIATAILKMRVWPRALIVLGIVVVELTAFLIVFDRSIHSVSLAFAAAITGAVAGILCIRFMPSSIQ